MTWVVLAFHVQVLVDRENQEVDAVLRARNMQLAWRYDDETQFVGRCFCQKEGGVAHAVLLFLLKTQDL